MGNELNYVSHGPGLAGSRPEFGRIGQPRQLGANVKSLAHTYDVEMFEFFFIVQWLLIEISWFGVLRADSLISSWLRRARKSPGSLA